MCTQDLNRNFVRNSHLENATCENSYALGKDRAAFRENEHAASRKKTLKNGSGSQVLSRSLLQRRRLHGFRRSPLRPPNGSPSCARARTKRRRPGRRWWRRSSGPRRGRPTKRSRRSSCPSRRIDPAPLSSKYGGGTFAKISSPFPLFLLGKEDDGIYRHWNRKPGYAAVLLDYVQAVWFDLLKTLIYAGKSKLPLIFKARHVFERIMAWLKGTLHFINNLSSKDILDPSE